jgi:hypothetical protein
MQTYHNLMKYSRVLLANSSQRTTELFIDYYTGRYQPRTEVESPAEPQAQSTSTLQSLAAFLPLPYVNIGARPEASEVEEDKTIRPPSYQVPKPRTAFSSFVDHPPEFITFLEALIKQQDVKEEDKVDLFTTLFEMYLDIASRKKDATEKDEWEVKAKQLIEGKDVRTRICLPLSDYLTEFRFRYPPRVSCSSRTCLAFEKGRPLYESRKAFDRTYSDHSPLRKTLKARSGL